ncbi:MAG: choice-of-anchor J domain-containing protein, partial [Bacteroidales bacterium]
TIKLMQIPYSTVYVNAQMQENKSVELSWKETADMNFTRLIYDNGIASTAYGTRPEKEGWFGSMFAVSDSGILESVDIFGAKHAALEAGDLGKRKVTVDIFDAHRKIVATSEAFYLPSENWINIPLDYFPYKGTFYVMVHFPVTEAENYNNLVGGDIKGPNANNQTNYYSANGVWGVVQTISNVVPFCFLIRANVFTQGEKVQLHPGAEPSTYIPEMKLTTTEQQDLLENVFDRAYTPSSKIASDFIMSAPSKVAAPKYAIYRFSETQKEQMDAWTLLNQTAISDKSYIDNTFTSLPQGSYYYAIRSIYGENLTSEPAYSQIVHKDMITTLTIQGTTNIQNGKIEGAQVNLTNFDNNPAHVYTGVLDANGKLSISQIWKGKYKIHLSKLGYETLDTTGLFTTESNYTMAVVLKQDKKKPYALQVTPDDLQANTYKFTWNDKKDIVEGFESHSDFTINSGGKLGWSYIDADNLKTYGIQGVSFKNQGQEMAYIIFNPSQTNPPLTNEVAFPYRGKKFLAGFSTSLGQNDDWLLSPELHYTNEFTFSFFAKTFSAVKGLEQIQVGYSVNGKDPSDFVWIQEGNALFVPTTWSEYSYTIPGNVKYVAIRYISNDMFMLMIDEIFIGNEKPGESPIKGFKVYLDGTEVAQTQTNEYVFTNITNPENHKAGVVALYESGESKMSEIGFIPVGIEKNDFADQINIYPNPAQNYIFLEGLNQNATYEIYNIYGSMIKTNRTTKDREQISIADLSSGSYVIRIISNKNIAVKRFIKK